MEEESGKAPGDAAELPETTADLPKKAIAAATTTVSEKADSPQDEAPDVPKVNGICNDVKEEEEEAEVKQEVLIDEEEKEEKKESAEEKEGWFYLIPINKIMQ